MKTKIYNKISTSILTILALILFGTTTITAAPGDLDTTFGSGGIVTTPITNYSDRPSSIQVQPDGKIVGFGNGVLSPGAMRGFAVARVHPNGSPDTNFGTNDRQLTTIGTNANYGFAVALQADGKILGGGGRRDGMFATDVAIVRYNGLRRGQISTLTATANLTFRFFARRMEIGIYSGARRALVLSISTSAKIFLRPEIMTATANLI